MARRGERCFFYNITHLAFLQTCTTFLNLFLNSSFSIFSISVTNSFCWEKSETNSWREDCLIFSKIIWKNEVKHWLAKISSLFLSLNRPNFWLSLYSQVQHHLLFLIFPIQNCWRNESSRRPFYFVWITHY